MLRTLKPVEIAEGALLADIAVIYQLLVNYVPFIGEVFRFPIFIVFAILVLRRGLYVSIMSGCVAVFLAGILMGPFLLPFFTIEILGGLYLGVTMRYRLPHLWLILLGSVCGSLTFYLVLGLLAALTNVPARVYIQFLHTIYSTALSLFEVIVQRLENVFHIGIQSYWLHHLLPLVTTLSDFAFTYWWVTLFLLFWGFSLVATLLIYTFTNLVVQMLGYEVRPFPSERFMRRIQHLRRAVTKMLRLRCASWRSHAKI